MQGGLRWNAPFGVGAVFASAIVLAFLAAGVLQPDLLNWGGIPQLGRFFVASLRPEMSWEILAITWDATRLTFAYAVCGTCLSVLLGTVGGLFCSEVWWAAIGKLAGFPFFRFVRALLAIPRSIHELIWGLLFVNLWGTESLTAVLAIAIPFGAITTKVFAEILDETPRQPLYALLNSGTPPLSAFCYSLLPQAWLNLLSYGFYRFECAIRSAAVLGMIGAGGLGYQILLSLQSLRYEQVWTFIYALLLLNGLVDFASAWLRRQLGCASRLDLNLPQSIGRKLTIAQRSCKNRFQNFQPFSFALTTPHTPHPIPQSTELWLIRLKTAVSTYLLLIVCLVLIGFSFWYVDADFSQMWATKTWRLLGEMVQASLPPDLSILPQLVRLSLQTIVMSVLAIALAGIGGMVLSFPAAYTIVLPGGLLNPTAGGWLGMVLSWSVLLLTRFLLLLSRAVPAPVWALVVLFVLFPGILPGAIALGIHNFGILGRLKAEVVENLDERPLTALKAQGVPGALIFLYGVLPLTLPRFLAYDLYRWEVCMRETAIVGIVGAGGLGYLMNEQLSSFDYQGLIVTLTCFLALTFGIDWLSAIARRALR
ncbi:MAG: ABC transporter permease subunit [Leptolyngbyaceae cyanobacterium bins.302]|nr:ABC transporter permease subunit [Leptolyngbyaceae cyanobacterium bins.302]